MKIICGLAVLTVTLVAAGACSSGDSNSALTTPTTSTATLITESFSGTVPVLGNDFHAFNVSQAGEVDAALITAGPPSTIVMGLAVGQPPAANSTVCLPIGTADVAGGASALGGTVATAGTYCVMVYDLGNATTPIAYTVSVRHP